MTEDRDKGRDERSSDVPADLAKEREAFVRSFLRRGVELTEELLGENVDLRQQVARLERHNARLRAQVASDDAIRDLLKTIEQLEREKYQLLERSTSLEATQRADESRYEQVEAELNDLANLYIASYQLHAGLSVRRVVRHLKDTLQQLVGADRFVIFVLDGDRRQAVPIGSEGYDEDGLGPIRVGEGPVGEVLLTGIERIRGELSGGSLEDPVAVIPLIAEGQPVGAVAIATMLEQKRAWASVDRELFKLLGAHAGAALIAANLYATVGSPQRALEGVVGNLLRRATDAPPTDGD